MNGNYKYEMECHAARYSTNIRHDGVAICT